jgi:hypothetical protein
MYAEFQFSELAPSFGTGTVASSLAVAGSVAPTLGVCGYLDGYAALTMEAVLTQDTGGTQDVFVQCRINGVWTDFIHFAQLTAGSSTFKYAVACTLAGGSAISVPVATGDGLTPALAAATATGGAWGNELRMVFKPGTGAVGGSSQILRILAQGPNKP